MYCEVQGTARNKGSTGKYKAGAFAHQKGYFRAYTAGLSTDDHSDFNRRGPSGSAEKHDRKHRANGPDALESVKKLPRYIYQQ